MSSITVQATSATLYGCAALAYAVLTALLLRGHKDRHLGFWLLSACAATSAWAASLAVYSYRPVALEYVYGIEWLHAAVWLQLLLRMGRAVVPRFLIMLVYFVLAALLLTGVGAASWARAHALQFSFRLLSVSGLLSALGGLVLLEQLYRNASQTARHGLRYFVLALGLIFTYDIFMYAEADMIHGITREAWAMRAVMAFATAPLLAFAMRKSADWLVDIFVSREVMFYTATVIAVGIYLLLMAFGGYYIRLLGTQWALALEVAFLLAASGILVMLLSSSLLRRHLQVFIAKHFYANKYDYRMQWLKFNETLSNGAKDNVYRAAAQAVAQAVDSPGAVLFIADESESRFSPAALWPALLGDSSRFPDVTRDDELVRFLGRRTWVVDLDEYRRDPNVYDNCHVPAWLLNDPQVRIVSPILELGRLVGFFVLHSPPPPFELTYEDRDLLKTIGTQVATQIAQQRADRKLTENRQFEAFNRLAAFAMHDIKNCIAQLQLVVSNAEQHRHNPEFIDDVFDTVNNVTQRMTHLMGQLQRGDTMTGSQQIDLRKAVNAVLERCRDRLPRPSCELADESLPVYGDYEQLVSVVEHLVRNAQDATPPDGSIRLSLDQRAGYIELNIVDTGCGMDAEFVRERLFRPFDSTKGTKGMGIGVYQAREYVRRVGGEMEVSSSPGSGTKFSIMLPRWTGTAGITMSAVS